MYCTQKTNFPGRGVEKLEHYRETDKCD